MISIPAMNLLVSEFAKPTLSSICLLSNVKYAANLILKEEHSTQQQQATPEAKRSIPAANDALQLVDLFMHAAL